MTNPDELTYRCENGHYFQEADAIWCSLDAYDDDLEMFCPKCETDEWRPVLMPSVHQLLEALAVSLGALVVGGLIGFELWILLGGP